MNLTQEILLMHSWIQPHIDLAAMPKVKQNKTPQFSGVDPSLQPTKTAFKPRPPPHAALVLSLAFMAALPC